MSATTDPVSEFKAHLSQPKPIEISQFLDALGHEDRVRCIRSTGRADQQRLWDAVDGFAPVRLAEIVPPDIAAMETVRHFGKNTLPLFSEFEKRFCRPPEVDPAQPSELHGFNYQTMQPVTGPGYFVAVEDAKRSEVLVDYRRVPANHPEGWPEIRSNERGLSRFVYGFMVDTLRRVSQHVTIGSAARKGKDMGSWFMLSREP